MAAEQAVTLGSEITYWCLQHNFSLSCYYTVMRRLKKMMRSVLLLNLLFQEYKAFREWRFWIRSGF